MSRPREGEVITLEPAHPSSIRDHPGLFLVENCPYHSVKFPLPLVVLDAPMDAMTAKNSVEMVEGNKKEPKHFY